MDVANAARIGLLICSNPIGLAYPKAKCKHKGDAKQVDKRNVWMFLHYVLE